MHAKGTNLTCVLLRSTKHPEWRSAKPSNWLEHRVDARGWRGGGEGVGGKQAGKVLIWSLTPAWPDLLADLGSSVSRDRLVRITAGPAG